MKITVIGCGYVGLVVGTGLAESGHTVVCVDRDRKRIEGLKRGELPIVEPGLEELVARNVEEERLRFTTSVAEAVADCLLVFICVGTPYREDGGADVSAVYEAAREIGQAMTGYRIIVNKSTCPVGASEKVKEIIREQTSHDFDVVVNPEFLKEGAAVDDFMRPDRIVVGCDDVRVEEIMKELYAPFLRTGKPFLTMSIRSAEMTKYAVNCMLAARISFMNELAAIAETNGADIGAVREGLASDERIGPAYLFPGLGFGGSCLPKDVAAAAYMAREGGLDGALLDAILKVNDTAQRRFIRRILGYYGAAIREKTLAMWGLSFKPRTDDIRSAPSLRIIDALLEAGAKIQAFDPAAGPRVREVYGDRVPISPKAYHAIEGADGLIICTEWNEFRRPDFDRMGELMREKVIFDGRNIYTPKIMERAGFKYFSVGRPAIE